MKKIFVLIVVLLMPFLVLSKSHITRQEKLKVKRIIAEIETISSNAKSLNDFGQKCMKQSAQILKMGAPAVYALSLYTDHKDWKVRFWIVDIMGYLDNADAQRPLLRVISNDNEQEQVKQRAIKSLNRLKILSIGQ